MRRRVRSSPRSNAALLAQFFRRNGYVRLQDRRRAEKEGWAVYKKGDEVRLVAQSMQELTMIRSLLIAEGFTPGRPFVKGRQLRQPIYGRKAVARFLELLAAQSPT